MKTKLELLHEIGKYIDKTQRELILVNDILSKYKELQKTIDKHHGQSNRRTAQATGIYVENGKIIDTSEDTYCEHTKN